MHDKWIKVTTITFIVFNSLFFASTRIIRLIFNHIYTRMSKEYWFWSILDWYIPLPKSIPVKILTEIRTCLLHDKQCQKLHYYLDLRFLDITEEQYSLTNLRRHTRQWIVRHVEKWEAQTASLHRKFFQLHPEKIQFTATRPVSVWYFHDRWLIVWSNSIKL